jgi:TolA-binding protein
MDRISMLIYKKRMEDSMKRIHKVMWGLGLSAIVMNLSVVTRAEEKKSDQSIGQYLEELQTKLDHTARRANQPTAEGSSVVGLRGTKQEAASKQLYWKGKKGKVPVTTDEVKDFRSAVEQAQAGKTAEATASLKTFEEKYPKSPLLPDVQETLSRLGASTSQP